MQVEVLESTIGDNLFYLIEDGQGTCALVDPIDGDLAVREVRDRGLDLSKVINTHFHPDHVGGNDTVFAAFPGATLVGPRAEAEGILGQIERDALDEAVSGGDRVQVGALELEVLDTPGHTPGHISLRGGSWLFCGDVIFVGGAGNCRFGGDPGVLFKTFRDVVSDLDDEVRFGPGHDYARRNIEFCLSLQPDHLEATRMLERVEAESKPLLTTLGEERTYNPFMRFGDPSLQKALKVGWQDVWDEESARSESVEETTFRTTRSLRNTW